MQLIALALFINRRVHRDRDEIGVPAVSAGVYEYTATLYVIGNILKGGGRPPPTLTGLD
jgi:hypothetical protein